MEKYDSIEEIPQEKFQLVQHDKVIYDQELSTKSISYFQDALHRFTRNKSSVIGAILILIIILFSIIAPLLTPYEVSTVDGAYAKARPKIKAFERSGFWDGHKKLRSNDRYLIFLNSIGTGAEDQDGQGASWDEGRQSQYRAINSMTNPVIESGKRYRNVDADSYYLVGFNYVNLTKDQFDKLKDWEDETGLPVIYPMVDKSISRLANQDANYWYKHSANGTPLDEKGKQLDLETVMQDGLVDNYVRDEDGNVQYYVKRDKTMVEARVLYYNYFRYLNGFEPAHALGSDAQGYDILSRVSQGTRLSLALAICVSIFNFVFGALYGAIQGYYGGATDLILDRITDIISGMPSTVVMVLFQAYLVSTGKVNTFTAVLFAFCFQGWIGTAYRVRTQFYRFKNEEYILSARSMGASDARLMFRHIFPNAIGTIITSSALTIPSTILSESTLSYIGVINFNSRELTSLGTMLSNGQGFLATDPHILFVPAIVISVLMISFNLFGNGLRDAFNPALRGADE